MNTKELIMKELDYLPDSIAIDVLNYIKYLEKKQYESMEEIAFGNAYVSEKSFEKIWLNDIDSEYDKL